MQPGDFQDFGGAEAGTVDCPTTEEIGRVFGDAAGGEKFHVVRQRNGFGEGAIFLVVIEREGKAVEEIGGSDGVGTDEDAGGNSLLRIEETVDVSGGIAEGEPGDGRI